MNDRPQLALETERVVGRERELEAINSALRAKETRAVILTGEGGLGKTRLLKEGILLAEQLGLRTSGLVDLYHSDMHTNSGIEAAIADGLDPASEGFPGGKAFRKYRHERTEYERLRREGVGPGRLEELRGALLRVFVSDYNTLAKDSRTVLAFDTAELIQFEADVVQHICQVEEGALEVKAWLLTVLPQLKNTVVLIAGRGSRREGDARQQLWDDFERVFSKRAQEKGFAWDEFDLPGLSEAESLQYFREVAAAAHHRAEQLRAKGDAQAAKVLEDAAARIEDAATRIKQTEEAWNRVYDATEGHPIRLGLMVDFMVNGDIALFYEEENEEEEKEAEKGKRWNGLAPRVVEDMLTLQLDYPVKDTLRYLAATRQGLDADLLHHLEPGWSRESCVARLMEMTNFTFVKTRPGTEVVFLHDEMYELLLKHMIRPRFEDFIGIYQRIARYYSAQLTDVGAQQLAEVTDLHVIEQEDLIIRRLHYELWVNPTEGFKFYIRQSEQAIKDHETGFDMRLRDELLRFVDDPANLRGLSRDVVDRDSAVRWVKRHIARTRYQRAVEVAETILAFGPEPYPAMGSGLSRVDKLRPELQKEAKRLFGVGDSLFWGDLLTYYGEALSDAGVPDEAHISRALQKAAELLSGSPVGEFDFPWFRTRLLGRTHNNLGHLAWSRQSYGRATEHYKTAIHFFRQLDILDEIAASTNNLAYVYGLKGELSWAEALADDALELRRRLGRKYQLALSLNTRGLIHNFANQPHRAYPRCKEALDKFADLEDRRGIGLACNALGHTRRLIANQWLEGVYTFERASEMYSEALDYLTRAIEAIPEERLRLIEAYNERGAVHRDWAILLLSWQYDRAAASEHFALAQADLERSLAVAGEGFPVQRADSLEDIADIYYKLGRYAQGDVQRQYLDRAESYVEQAEKLIPDEYRLVPGAGFTKVEDPAEGMWQMMGTLLITRGRVTSEPIRGLEELSSKQVETLLKAMTHFTLAMAYLLKFAPNPDAHRGGLAVIYRRLKGYSVPRLEQVRRHVEAVAGEYRVDIGPLLNMIDDVLGLRSQLI